ncbi:hypothetical protein ACLKA7_006390 [Drosophila subpalustris]
MNQFNARIRLQSAGHEHATWSPHAAQITSPKPSKHRVNNDDAVADARQQQQQQQQQRQRQQLRSATAAMGQWSIGALLEPVIGSLSSITNLSLSFSGACQQLELKPEPELKLKLKLKLKPTAASITALIPLLFSIFILVLRSVAQIETEEDPNTMRIIHYELWWQRLVNKINNRRDQMIKERADFQSNVFVPKITLGYAPNSTAGIRKLIEGVIRSMSMTPTQVSSFADCEELRIRAYSEQFIASICFDNVDESQRGLPLKLRFSILMPSELRNYEDSWIGDNWIVDSVYHARNGGNIDTVNSSISNYVREGFISLQYYISIEYLLIASGNDNVPEVILRGYSLNDNIFDMLSVGVNTPVVVLLLGFMFPVTIFTKEIVEERALGIHFALNTNHQATRIQFAVWYLNGLCLLLVTCMVFTLMLKINWGGHASFFSKCPWSIMLIFFLSYVLSAVAFAILLGVIMGSTKMVVAVVPVYWILASLPLLSGQTIDSTWGYFLLIVASLLLCNVTMCRGLRRILCLEYVERMNVKQYFMSKIISRDSTLLMFICVFYIQTFLYVLLALILDGNICPCLLRLIKCTPCRLLFVRIRRWYKRRARRKQQKLESEAELKENLSQRLSDLTERSEEFTNTVQLYREELRTSEKRLNNSDQSRRSTRVYHNEIPSKNNTSSSRIDSSDESNDTQPSMSASLPEKELLIWRSDYELREDNQSDKSTTYYLQQSSMLDKPTGNSEEQIDESQVDESSPVVIEFQNVWKKYSKTFEVRNFSLKVYQHETMVLLGHNASGKTSILNMICGVTLPTLGSIYISGYDVVKQSSRAYKNVGLSLHNLILFSEFTFFEHIVYLCRLRGMSLAQAQSDAAYYMQSLNVEHLKATHVNMLTTGQKRLLQMLCAFAGRTKIVLLDKPMEGVDAEKRRLFYNFAQRERQNRTIFLTTNFPHVARNLADRIGILINGNLHACGTEGALLKLDKNVYRLMCYLEPQCDFPKLFNYCAYHIPSIEIELKRGDSAVFLVEHFDLDRLMKLMNLLTRNKKSLHVEGYQLMTPNVEHVLLKAMMHKHKNTFVNYTLFNLATRIRHVEELQRSMKRFFFLPNISMFLRHLDVVLRKRCLMDMRNYCMPLFQIFFPGVMCAIILSMPHFMLDRTVLQSTSFTMNRFEHSVTLLKQMASLDPVLAASKHYHDHATAGQTLIDLDRNDDILDSIRLFMANKYLISDLDFVLAATFSDDYVEALYNSNLVNSAPVSLTLVMNALAVGFVNPSSGINVKLELLPFSTLHSAHLEDSLERLDWVFKVMSSFCFCFVWALPMLNFGLGRGQPYGRVELIAGMRFSTLSIGSFIYGMTKFVLSLIPLNAVMLMFNNALFFDTYDNYKYIYLVLIAGLYVLSIDILVSFWISEMRVGYVIVMVFYTMGILLYLTLSEIPNVRMDDFDDIFRIHPFYNLIQNMMQADNQSEISHICADDQSFETSVYLEQCQQTPNCCVSPQKDFFAWDLLWSTYLCIVLIWTVFYVVNFMVKSKLKLQKRMGKDNRDSNPDSCYDQNVIHFSNRSDRDKTWIREKIRARTLERPDIRNKALNVENLGVFFGPNVILHRINFILERHQALCVIGVNGSGKTVLIKSLLGTVAHSTGTIHSYCNPFYQREEEANCMHLAYCPQDDDIGDELTVTEVVQFVLIIRGLNKENVFFETNNLLRMFDLYNSRFHLLSACSRGVLKRLNIAMALIGYAGLILMDDPFSYLDASSWRKIYSILESQCQHGQAVLYTSSDPRYSDLSNRTAILQSPSVAIIGDRQELQLEHFAAYFVVETHIKLHKLKQNESEPLENWPSEDKWIHMQICSIVEHVFPHAIIKSRNRHMVSFWLSSKTYSMSHILETLHRNMNTFYAYSIQTPSIKSIFGNMVEGQNRFVQISEDEDSELLLAN